MQLRAERFDLFLSYRHRHTEVVRRLRDALEDRGIRVWFDETAIPDFAPITEAAVRGIAGSKALLAFYSEDYPVSRACQWELVHAFCAAQARGDPTQRVLVANPEPGADHIEPVELRDAKYVTVRGDESDAVRLAEAVAVRLASLDGPLGEEGAPRSRWLPVEVAGAPRFVGRAMQMWRVHSALHAAQAGMTQAAVGPGVAIVRGLGGVGKSLLAQEYALRFGAAYPGGVFWLRAFGSDAAELSDEQREAERHRQIEQFAIGLGVPVEARRPEEIDTAVGREIGRAGAACLWVVDDVPSGLTANDLRRYFAPHPLARTLVTTRSGEYAALGREIVLDVLEEHDALELLTIRRVPQTVEEATAARALVNYLGRHALAIDVAGAALVTDTFDELRSALADPTQDELELASELREQLPTAHERGIASTLGRSIDRLGAEGLDFLRLASALAVAPIPLTLIRGAFAECDGLDEQRARRRARSALDDAASLSLSARSGEDAWSVHTLVSRVVRFKQRADDRRRRLRSSAITVLMRELEAAGDVRAHARLQDLITHARELASHPSAVTEALLADRLARYYAAHGDEGSAGAVLSRSLPVLSDGLGDDHPDTLAVRANLAGMLAQAGDLDRAQELEEEVLDRRRHVLGDEHPETIRAMANLGLTLSLKRELPEAREVQRRALEAQLQLYGPEHPDTLLWMGNLAVTLRLMGELAEAAELEERVLAGRARILGADHPDALLALVSVAATAHAAGDLRRAAELEQRAFAGMAAAIGEEHPRTVETMLSLSQTLRDMGDLTAAGELAQRALATLQRTLGEHRLTIEAASLLADVRRLEGDLDAARELLEAALATARRVFGDGHERTLRTTVDLAQLCLTQGDVERARELTAELTAVLGPPPPGWRPDP